MTAALDSAREVLIESGYAAHAFDFAAHPTQPRSALAFEDETVIGFVLEYVNPADLIAYWKSDGLRVAAGQRDALVSAEQKTWNTYLVLVAGGTATFNESLAMSQIEENLEGMRKIARAGVSSVEHARQALLPLLPIRSKSTLEPVDMPLEIRTRTSELDPRIVEIFLARADEKAIVQLLEGEL
jgi:hypothetical protein